VVGSGPNGLTAAAVLARAGRQVLVLEALNTPGGGMRTEELTLPGYLHDLCSAAHPMGILSPIFRSLPLERHGLRWIEPPVGTLPRHPCSWRVSVCLACARPMLWPAGGFRKSAPGRSSPVARVTRSCRYNAR
jgi:choline dehydrogenase-like flavoprotein